MIIVILFGVSRDAEKSWILYYLGIILYMLYNIYNRLAYSEAKE